MCLIILLSAYHCTLIKRPKEIDLNNEDHPSKFIWHKAYGRNLLNYKNSLNSLYIVKDKIFLGSNLLQEFFL